MNGQVAFGNKSYTRSCSTNVSLTAVDDMQVPFGNKGTICRVGHTSDGRFLACGNRWGDTYVFDALKGTRLTHLRPRKVCAEFLGCS